MTVLEAAVSPAAHQRAHQRQEPAAGRGMQSRAARVHLSVHVGAVLWDGTFRSGATRASGLTWPRSAGGRGQVITTGAHTGDQNLEES